MAGASLLMLLHGCTAQIWQHGDGAELVLASCSPSKRSYELRVPFTPALVCAAPTSHVLAFAPHVPCCQALRNTVSVPRHWSQKRKYLQGKRGIEKPPFKLPDFIEATGGVG